MPSTPSQKSIDVWRSAPTMVMWWTPWLWSFRISARSASQAKRSELYAPRAAGDPCDRGAVPAACLEARVGAPPAGDSHTVGRDPHSGLCVRLMKAALNPARSSDRAVPATPLQARQVDGARAKAPARRKAFASPWPVDKLVGGAALVGTAD